MSKKDAEDQFFQQCLDADLPEPEREYRFHDTRKWRFDFCWPLDLVAVEIQGGTWSRGRHARGQGLLNDYEKHAEATVLGWRLLYIAADNVHTGQGIHYVERLLESEGPDS